MTLTVLFDLDDTLLQNPIRTFLPAYLQSLSASLDVVPPERVIQVLLEATQKMIESPAPARTLEENFDQHFYPALGQTRKELQQRIDHFYGDNYPSLQKLTSPQPAAVEVIEKEIEQGSTVAIATNPVFPATAIEQRVRWAGFPASFPFALVTNFSDFHYAKPHPAFYAEILAQLGWANQPAVMIGNDIQEDLIPASALGLPVFWVTKNQEPLPQGFHPTSRAGSLDQVTDWLDEIRRENLELTVESRPGILAVLKSTPAAIDTLRRKVTAPQKWHHKPYDNEWNATEIICHLRDVEIEVNLPRIVKITSEENPFLSGFSTDDWAEQREYNRQDPFKALADFIQARVEVIQLLEELDAGGWNRPARHAIFGPTILQELAGFISQHDKNHIQQIYPLLFNA